MQSELVFRTLDVPPVLAAQVHSAWELEGHCAAPTPQRVLPDGCVSVVINFGSPLGQADASGTWIARPGSLVIGEVRRAISLHSEGPLHLLGVRFWPGAGQEYLAAPLTELIGTVSGDAALETRVLRGRGGRRKRPPARAWRALPARSRTARARRVRMQAVFVLPPKCCSSITAA